MISRINNRKIASDRKIKEKEDQLNEANRKIDSLRASIQKGSRETSELIEKTQALLNEKQGFFFGKDNRLEILSLLDDLQRKIRSIG